MRIDKRARGSRNKCSILDLLHMCITFFFTDIDERKCRSEKSVRDKLYTWIAAISTRHGACLLQRPQTEAKFIGHHVSILRYGMSRRARGIGDISIFRFTIYATRWLHCVIIDCFLKSIEPPNDMLSLHKFRGLKFKIRRDYMIDLSSA